MLFFFVKNSVRTSYLTYIYFFFIKGLKQESVGSISVGWESCLFLWQCVGSLKCSRTTVSLQEWSSSTFGITRDCQNLSVAIISRDYGFSSLVNSLLDISNIWEIICIISLIYRNSFILSSILIAWIFFPLIVTIICKKHAPKSISCSAILKLLMVNAS